MDDEGSTVPGLIVSAIFLIGFLVAQKLIRSNNPQKTKLGHQLNSFLGKVYVYGFFTAIIIGTLLTIYFFGVAIFR
jgi:hypothetical protein